MTKTSLTPREAHDRCKDDLFHGDTAREKGLGSRPVDCRRGNNKTLVVGTATSSALPISTLRLAAFPQAFSRLPAVEDALADSPHEENARACAKQQAPPPKEGGTERGAQQKDSHGETTDACHSDIMPESASQRV